LLSAALLERWRRSFTALRPRSQNYRQTVVVIPLNPEGMGIGEWVILFSENFERMGIGMGMGMGNSKKLCA